jgi:hypothetical protein
MIVVWDIGEMLAGRSHCYFPYKEYLILFSAMPVPVCARGCVTSFDGTCLRPKKLISIYAKEDRIDDVLLAPKKTAIPEQASE